MRFTAEDIRRQIAAQAPPGGQEATQRPEPCCANMAAAAQSQLLEGCPVFIESCAAQPKLAKRIKDIVSNGRVRASHENQPGAHARPAGRVLYPGALPVFQDARADGEPLECQRRRDGYYPASGA